MKKYSEMFFESYTLAVEAAYDAYLTITEGRFPEGDDISGGMKEYLANEYKRWLCTPDDLLGGMTPEEFMNTVDSLEQLTDMFVYGAVACDEDLPENFLYKLKSHGEAAVDMLLGIACGRREGSSEESFLAPLMAVKVLGKWGVGRAVGPLIGIICSKGEVYELMYETVRDALISIGNRAEDCILDALGAGSCSQVAEEYLIMALSQIGRKYPADKIYRELKQAFLKMPQKIIPAACLADYGDGRAVPLLRGYLEKNAGETDIETYHEITSAIRRLGGRIDDLAFKN